MGQVGDTTVQNESSLQFQTSGNVIVREDSPNPRTDTVHNTGAELHTECNQEIPTQFASCEDVLHTLVKAVDDSGQFFLVIRRG